MTHPEQQKLVAGLRAAWAELNSSLQIATTHKSQWPELADGMNHTLTRLTQHLALAESLKIARSIYLQEYQLTGLDEQMLACKPGEYPWDHWHHKAVARGVPDTLARLGREVMREAYQHGWSDELKALCGWDDNGDQMIHLALQSPEEAAQTWRRLLDSDGGYGIGK